MQQQLAHYKIQDLLGEGSFASVYRAFDQKFERDVALKILKPVWLSDPEAVGRFKQEAKTMARLRHPHIVDVYDVGETEGYIYLSQLLVIGETLTARLERGPLVWPEMLAVTQDIASALDYAHDQGIVHRDIKPSNILLDQNGQAYLGDFGLVRAAQGSVALSTSAGGMIGTPAYMAPEQWETQNVTGATDVYALSCIVVEMLTGQVLFDGSTPPIVMRQHLISGPKFPVEWPEGIPPGVSKVLQKGLSQHPVERFNRAGELAAILAALRTSSRPVAASTETMIEPPHRPPSAPLPSEPSLPDRSVSAPARQQPAPRRSSSLTLVVISGVIALIITILIIVALTIYFVVRGGDDVVVNIPTVVITSPTNGSQVRANQSVTIQATASDPSGVTRMELWVSGLKIDEAASPVQGQSTLTTSFQWTPEAPGSYTLEMRAYNARGAVNAPTMVTVNAVAEGPDVTDTPTATPTPETPTPTPATTEPYLTTKTDLNVRSGPGTVYDLLGLLPTGTRAEISGRDESLQWWQIRFPPAPDEVGWVAAGPEYSEVFDADNVPIIQPPPTSTNTPPSTSTKTSPSPTNTPTPPPLPPTPTKTPPPLIVEFDVSPRSIEGGECVFITWSVSGVKEVYVNNQGVGGSGNIKDCPTNTTTYQLRVIQQDNSEYTEEKTVQVINPIVSTGIISIQPNQTVDFDQGVIPGNDFLWKVGTNDRLFEVQAGVQLAPMPPMSALDDLILAECANANFGSYTFIDASDVIADPGNALVAGRSACYRTNQGRLGKLRFPTYSSSTLQVEWLTWK